MRCSLCLLALLWAPPTLGSNLDAYFALHRMPVEAPMDSCGAENPNDQGIPCSEYSVTAPLGESYVFVVVANAGDEGVAGVDFGTYYRGGSDPTIGIDPESISFTSYITGFLYPMNGYGGYPYSRLKIIGYANPTCIEHPIIGDSGRHAMVGYFYVNARSEDVFQITAPAWQTQSPGAYAPASGTTVNISACDGGTIDLVKEVGWPQYRSRLGKVQFGGDGSEAFNPCLGVTPVKSATWGSLKALYRP